MEGVRERVKRAHHSSPDVIVGKKGVTREVLREIDARLRKKEVVKVKLLRSSVETEGRDRRDIAKDIARAVNAKLMGVRGRTFVLYRPLPRKALERKSGSRIAFKPRSGHG